MFRSGDKIEIASQKIGHPPRRGVVTGVSGGLLRIRWEDGTESSLIPGPGSISVVGRQAARPRSKSKPRAKSPAKSKAKPKSKKASRRARKR